MAATPEQLEALADEVEKSTGEDYELDFMIGHAVLPVRPYHVECPDYTSSLDAAMTLVPKGMAFTVGQNVHHWHWAASVNSVTEGGEPYSVGCSNACNSACNSLTVAALRARAKLAREKQE